MAVNEDELRRIVQRILDGMSHDGQWPKNITEEVFVTIESSYVYLAPYRVMVGRNGQNRDTVNQLIGKQVKELTGLETLREHVPTERTSLISAYTELG